MQTDRRRFMQLLTSGAAAASFPASIARALAIPAHHRTGTIKDVEHIVFMMQENRSFDHYFGTLRGVRGFGDPRPIVLPNGDPVWKQPAAGNPDGYELPFHPGAPNLGLQFLEDLPHDWTSTHGAWNQGNYDEWIANKTPTTMAHLVRSDIPYHYALADAFTICDAYHCSLLGPTDPNRYHMWTGWVGNDGQNGGPVIDNAEAGYDWSTYPEILQNAGVSWKVYQDIGEGLDAAHFWGWTGDNPYIGNYGDNSLLYFHQYQKAAAGTPLANGAKTGTDIAASGSLFDQLKADVASGNLPQVSWIVAPEAYTEHPNWPANYGAWYVSQMLDIFTSNPDLWSKTVFILTYDENDGFFDHVVPPTPPQSRAEGISTVGTTNEIFPGDSSYAAGPYGLGVRVPMIVISPWSKGGFVNSQVFDHTSLIQFIERRFGPTEPNITQWRRSVSGDLTSAFNFRNPNDATVPLPSTVAYVPPDNQRHPDYVPTVPSPQAMPAQEPGLRPAKALPYRLHVHGEADFANSAFNIGFHNWGTVGAAFHVRSGNDANGPWTYTIGAGDSAEDTWSYAGSQGPEYDLSVHGPNGFLRVFKGSVAGKNSAHLKVRAEYDSDDPAIVLEIENRGVMKVEVSVADFYTGETKWLGLRPGESRRESWRLRGSFGWYDLTVEADSDTSFQWRFAGHVENGHDSFSDPAIGSNAVQPQAVTHGR